MNATLVHRGPDDDGQFVSNSIGLGFRRLSIIDLACGRQPMSDEAETVWVIFNGEIYNFKELRTELEAFGHKFRTTSDTEVIVHGYKQWGVNVLDHLNGMFGLAIWDADNRQLMLARDRLGIKPLYYRLRAGTVHFGSEIRSLIALDHEKPTIEPAALSLFLQHRYVPSPMTILHGVQRLAPGTRLIVKERGEPRVELWWKYRPVPFDRIPTEREAAETLLALARQAVRRQLVSDVPVGLLLSGGLDSGFLLALMRECGSKWNTYTVGYGDSYADDELSDAAITARHFGVPNTSIKIDRTMFENTLWKVASIVEEPVTASSVVPMYYLCQRARQDVKVVLMGQGPDELFGGYTRHLGVAYGGLWRAVPELLRPVLSSIGGRVFRSEAIRRAQDSLGVADRIERYQRVLSICPRYCVRDFFHEGLLQNDATDSIRSYWKDLLPLMESTDELGGLQFLELRSSLPDELLIYADKISMAHGLEVRVPYLDHDLVEYAERLSASFKVRRGKTKWLYRQATRSFLPPDVRRRKKRGFSSDIDGWFRSSLSEKLNRTLVDSDCIVYRYLRPKVIRQLLLDHQAGRSDNHKILFSIVLLEELLRGYV